MLSRLGFEEVAERKLTKGQKGHLAKASAPMVRRLREFRSDDAAQFAPGDVIKADIFSRWRICGRGRPIPRARGFAGAVKRHGFAGGPKTHGQSDRHRATGSRGAGTNTRPYLSRHEGAWPNGRRAA